MITYVDFLETVINDGIRAAERDYATERSKREGAVTGFEACRGKAPQELGPLLAQAHRDTRAHRNVANDDGSDLAMNNYWQARCYELEIEWVCNVVSAMLVNQMLPPIVPPTARGMRKAAEVLGVA
jgi:hypothetical protein